MHEILKICNVILQLNLLAVPFSGKVQSSQSSSQRSSRKGIFFEVLIRETLFQSLWQFELRAFESQKRTKVPTWWRYRSAIMALSFLAIAFRRSNQVEVLSIREHARDNGRKHRTIMSLSARSVDVHTCIVYLCSVFTPTRLFPNSPLSESPVVLHRVAYSIGDLACRYDFQ